MFIACKQPAQTEVRGTSYNFIVDKFGRFVAEVHNVKDQTILLAVVDQYREIEDPEKPDPDPNAEQPVEEPVQEPVEETPIAVTEITGIGAAIASKLADNGITDARQIAKMTPDDAAALDDKLGLGGRVTRDDWIGQAKALVG
jgi:predicted flap endonuclease-1-like 5' DNA nuclease